MPSQLPWERYWFLPARTRKAPWVWPEACDVRPDRRPARSSGSSTPLRLDVGRGTSPEICTWIHSPCASRKLDSSFAVAVKQDARPDCWLSKNGCAQDFHQPPPNFPDAPGLRVNFPASSPVRRLSCCMCFFPPASRL